AIASISDVEFRNAEKLTMTYHLAQTEERLAVLTASRPQVSLFRERSDAESASVIGARHARRGRHHETRHRGHHREIRGHHGIHHYGIRHRGRGTLLH